MGNFNINLHTHFPNNVISVGPDDKTSSASKRMVKLADNKSKQSDLKTLEKGKLTSKPVMFNNREKWRGIYSCLVLKRRK